VKEKSREKIGEKQRRIKKRKKGEGKEKILNRICSVASCFFITVLCFIYYKLQTYSL